MCISPSPMPRISGLPLRATTIRSGKSRSMTAMPYVPSIRRRLASTLSSRVSPSACSIRCASTSVSVSERSLTPASYVLLGGLGEVGQDVGDHPAHVVRRQTGGPADLFGEFVHRTRRRLTDH